MNKFHNLLLFFILMIAFIFMSQDRDQYVPAYGGKIQFDNNSLYNIFIIFQTEDNKEKMLCIEKDEQIQIGHSSYNKLMVNPANFYTAVSLYDLDTGTLLTKFNTNTEMFVLKSGNINSNNALFELIINDKLPESGI